MLILSASAGCGGNVDRRATPVNGGNGSSAASRLAALEVPERPVPPSLVRGFDAVLDALETRCAETRDVSPSLADIAIDAVARSHQSGHDITHLDALRAPEGSIIDCTDAAKRLFEK
jgi:hypothetical protein